MTELGRLRIECPQVVPRGQDVHVFLNDTEITRGLKSLSLDMEAQDVNVATMEVFLSEVQIDGEYIISVTESNEDMVNRWWQGERQQNTRRRQHE